jgi:hypothetical protein
VATTDVEDVNGGPLGVLAAGLAVATTKAGDIDGEPPGLHGDNEVGYRKRCW